MSVEVKVVAPGAGPFGNLTRRVSEGHAFPSLTRRVSGTGSCCRIVHADLVIDSPFDFDGERAVRLHLTG